MNFRAFFLILGVFLSVLRICYVESPGGDAGPKIFSEDQNISLNAAEANEVKLNYDLSDSSSSISSSSSSSSSYTTSSLSSSSSISLSTDTSTESTHSSSPEKGISSSELEQLVIPTVAPATPYFDTDSISSSSSSSLSSSVIVSVTESIHQEKKLIEDDKPQNKLIMSSGINSEKKEISVDEAKAEKQEDKNVDEKPSKEEILSEKSQEDQSEVISIPTAEAEKENKDDAVSSISVLTDNQEESKKDVKDKNDETETKEDESKDKEVDSITAGLKQAEEETKPTSEEMPSFDEFKRQHLQEEEEKQKNILKKQQEVKDGPETLSKTKTRKVKQRKQNNYASLDCGAKILKANPEASNIFSILQDNRDLYMLNPCSAKIWFIVELCDNVQVKTIEVANFELFSSTPESFKVYVSGRYPTREWTLLGTFQAREERNLQSFPLDEPIYAKYIKVEMLSHFGSEHYCPLSLFRVFGTSMMEELEDHEADGQDDGDAVDHDDDVAQVLPPNPSVKADDKETKSTANIFATVGDTLFNIVKVAAKKLKGVIDSEQNLTSDSLGLSTVAPSSGVVSSTTANGQDAKSSIVTLIPSEDDDDKLHDSKQENVTSNVTGTNTTETKKPDKQENKEDNTTFYEKIDSDGSRSSRTTSAFTSCELLVRMLGHSSFGCMMGKVLYSKRKYRGVTPREESPTRQKTSARNVKLPPGSDSTPDTSAEKGKEDSKKNGEKKEGEKEREKVEQKGKKNGKEKVDNENDEAIVKKERNENEIISKSINEGKKKDSFLETTSSSDVKSGQDSKESAQVSFNGAIDPASIVQPSEVEPPIKKPCDPSSEEKGTPVLTTVSILTTHPSSQNTDSQSTQATNSDIQSTANPSEKPKDGISVSDNQTTKDDASTTKPEVQDETGVSENTKQDEVDLKTKSVESVVTKNESTVAEAGSSTVSGEESSASSRDTCASADSLDKSLIKPSPSSSPSECKAPTIVAHPKDVDVLEFKMLDSAGREGTAHLEKPDKPDQPAVGKEPLKESKEQEIKESDSTLQSDTGPSLTQEASDIISVSQEDEPSVSAPSSSSSVEQLKPSVVELSPPSEPTIPAQPTQHPDVSPQELPESISPLQPPPVDKAPVVPPSSSVESSITDDLSSVLSKASSSAGVGGQGLVGSGAQKESIFMRLTNRIKALEQNLTLSTMYMEKLNQKYRKMVEEMQKNFDKKVNLLTNATIKAESVIRSQKEQISNLQAKIDETSRDMKQFNIKIANLNIQVMERHIIGLFLEVILIMILFIVFRRWDRARIRRDILRESRMNGTAMTSHPYSSHNEDHVLGKILNGQLSAREQLQRSFANPCEPENIGTFSESVAHKHKEEFFPPLDSKKKRNRKRPKSGIITTESSQAKSVSESTNQSSPSGLVSVTAGLLFSPARGLLNGFTRSQSLDDSQLKRKSSVPSTTTLSKTKSLNVINEDLEKISFSTANTKKGRIPTPPPPPSPQKYWTTGSMDGLHQKRLPGQQLSSLKMTQKKGRGLNGTNPYA